MRKRRLRDLERPGHDGLAGARVLLRVDYNVQVDEGGVLDDLRLRESVPTIQALRAAGARVVICSHRGRPGGAVDESLRNWPVARRLEQLLDAPVSSASDCVGPDVELDVAALAPGEVLLLENVRFHPGEEADDRCFVAALARLADVFVNDAFGTAHRAHGSIVGPPRHLPAAAGLLLQREVKMLERVTRAPEPPLALVLGGAKVSDKLASLQALARHADTLAIGGAMAYTFLAGEGRAVGASRLEPDRIEDARRVSRAALDAGRRLLLPRDHRVVERIQTGAPVKVVQEIPDGWIAVDLGPEPARDYADEASRARTLFWNGPMGIFEVADYAAGTETVAHAVAGSRANTIVGGGDSLAAVNHLGLGHRIDHLSTGGGASLEYIQGRTRPGVAALQR